MALVVVGEHKIPVREVQQVQDQIHNDLGPAGFVIEFPRSSQIAVYGRISPHIGP